MRLNSKVAVVIAAAVLVLGMSVATAVAAVVAQQTVALKAGEDMGSGFTGTYGGEIVLQPAVISNKAELPGDKFHFQAYVMDVESSGTGIPTGMVWKDFKDFEDIQLEDTNTVLPFTFQIGLDDGVILSDGTVIHPPSPYQIRCEYKTLDSSGTANSTSPKSFSETETVTVIKNTWTKVSFSTSGTVKHAGTNFHFQVSPACGEGTIRVTVKKPGSKTLTYDVATDENGSASAKLKLGTKNGTYKVFAKFLGNDYGVASGTAIKNVHAAH